MEGTVEKQLHKLKKQAVSRPVVIGVLALLIGGIVYAAVHFTRSSEGPWMGFAYPDKSFSVAPTVLSAKEINFNWDLGSPDKSIPTEGFATRWVTCLVVSEPITVWFSARADDGCQLFVDDKLVGGDWDKPVYQPVQKAITFQPGVHPIRVESYELSGYAGLWLQMRMENAEGPPVPASLLKYPSVQDELKACNSYK